MRQVFFFGRDAKLALAEALFFLRDRKIEFSLVEKKESFAVFDFPNGFDSAKAVNALGGTAKIAKVLFETKKPNEKNFSKGFEENSFFDSFYDKLFYYAVALSGNANDTSSLQAAVKQGFKRRKIKAMFKHPREHKTRAMETLNPSELKSWKMLDSGCEIIGIVVGETFLVCRTIAATDMDSIQKRDAQRPCLEPQKAISIRLARILLNLAGVREGKTVLDPFCGIGTILQEAMLNGAIAVGVELDFETGKKARKNLEWFVKTIKQNGKWRVLQGNSAKLSGLLKKGDFDCVATEPFMGPFINSILPEPLVKKTVAELETLYAGVFSELSKLMVAGQRVSFILPSLPATNSKKYSVNESVFLKAGFVVVNSPGEEVFPYSYVAIESKILRRIFVLEKA